jgi:hypothetical protein
VRCCFCPSEPPFTNPRGIFSRSASVNASREHRPARGRMLPVGLMCEKIEPELLPKTRPIATHDADIFRRLSVRQSEL